MARVDTDEGPLELLQRGDRDFIIQIDGRMLMSSQITLSELAVAELGCAPIRDRKAPRVLIGGLGLGFTLRAALDALPADAHVDVAELNAVVVDWCRGPAAVCAGDTLADPRVHVIVGDVTDVIRDAASRGPRYDAIVVDLYLGPDDPGRGVEDPLYGYAILERVHAALTKGGMYAVWGEVRYRPFEDRLRDSGFQVEFKDVAGGGPRHAVYLARRP